MLPWNPQTAPHPQRVRQVTPHRRAKRNTEEIESGQRCSPTSRALRARSKSVRLSVSSMAPEGDFGSAWHPKNRVLPRPVCRDLSSRRLDGSPWETSGFHKKKDTGRPRRVGRREHRELQLGCQLTQKKSCSCVRSSHSPPLSPEGNQLV